MSVVVVVVVVVVEPPELEPKSQSFRTVAMPSIIELDRGEMLVAFMGGMSEVRWRECSHHTF